MLVIGIDGATWDIIEPNLDKLENFRKLIQEGKKSTINLSQKPWSPSVWCSMFSGKSPEEHGHRDFVRNGEVVRREDIKVDFIWDILQEKGVSVRVLGVPFVIPPYNFNVDFEFVANGVPVEIGEIEKDLENITEKAEEILSKEKPEVFIVVYTTLDRVCHLHWGEPVVLDMYRKLDEALGRLIKHDKEVIVISDHGFCDYDKAPVRTLPRKTPRGEIKGDHHPDAVLITRNVQYQIKQPEDVFFALKEKYMGGE